MLHLLPCTHHNDFISCQTFWDKDCSVFAVTSCSVLQVVQSYGHCQHINLIYYKPLQEKCNRSQIRRSTGKCGNQEVDHLQPNHQSGNCLVKNVVTSLWICDGALSFWTQAICLPSGSWDVIRNSNTSWWIIPLTV